MRRICWLPWGIRWSRRGPASMPRRSNGPCSWWWRPTRPMCCVLAPWWRVGPPVGTRSSPSPGCGPRRAIGRFFEQHDVLLTPTCAAPPLPIRTVDTRTEDLAAYYDALHAYNTFTTPYNCAGVPAASVPLHWADGLPIGVQMASGFGRDAVLLNLAAQLEAARPWFDRRPERWAGADWGAD